MKGRILAAWMLMGLGACAGESDTPPEEAAQVAAAAPQEVRFVARDFSFEGPSTIEAGLVTFVLANEGPEWHHLQLVRLPDDMTYEQFQEAMAQGQPGTPPPPWLEETGGVNPPEPGHETRATMRLEPGSYVVLCFVDTPDHVPHMAKGMMQPLTVTEATGPAAAAPTADMSVTLADYTFAFSEAPTAGAHVIRVENAGPQAHEIVLAKFKPGMTMDDLGAFAQTYDGEAPVTLEGGVPAFEPGMEAYMEVTFTPGDWVALCFVPDANDGQGHIVHGMALPFTVE